MRHGQRIQSCFLPILILFTMIFIQGAFAQNWLKWGGPNGDFTVQTSGLAESWQEGGPGLLWKRPLGEGYSSILYKDGLLYTMYSDSTEEVIICLDSRTGKTKWEHRYIRELWPDMRRFFGDGPNATPVIIKNRIISIGIAGHMRCLDLSTGKLIWKRNLTVEFGRLERMEEYGYSASPIPYYDFIIVQVGGNDHAVIAVDPETGTDIWESAPGGVSYAQASIIKLAGHDQYIYFSPEGVNGLDPPTGEMIWHFTIPVSNGNHLTSVVQCDENHLFISSQFDSGGGRLLKIYQDDNGTKVKQIWFDSELQASCWTNVCVGGTVYGSAGGHTFSLLTAFDWRTGEVFWQERGYKMAQCLLADNKLIYLAESGKLVLADFSPEYLDILDTAQVMGKVSWTLPTLVSTKLFVRDRMDIVALELGNNK